MRNPRPRGTRRVPSVVLSVFIVCSGFAPLLLPSFAEVALARNGQALGDTIILAGPGGDFGILTVAPAGATLSVDGDPVDGYYPVTYDGVSGWTAVGLVDVSDNGGGGGNGGGGNGGGGNGGDGKRDKNRDNGNGGVETVTADPVVAEPVTAEPVTGGAYGPGGGGYSEQQIVGIIHEAADSYGQSREDMVRVARCESALDPTAVGGGGSYYGLFQFVPSTFAATPYGQYDIFDPWANANAAAWSWSQGGKGTWSCQ